jgi:hypothetical protein
MAKTITGGGGRWSDTSTWDDGQPPEPDDDVQLDAPSAIPPSGHVNEDDEQTMAENEPPRRISPFGKPTR